MSHKVASPLDEHTPLLRDESHWSSGPAKWFAVIVLALATIAIASWSLWRRVPNPTLVRGVGTPQSLSPSHTGTQPHASGTITGLIDLNTADATTLESLPGIGPALAQRIIDSRTQLGAFTRVEDLDRVPGIGPKTIDKLRPLVRFTAPPKP